MAEPEPYRVLFLCTGNSARSPMAEALLNRWGRERFIAYSAGSDPKGFVHPQALAVLSQHHIAAGNLHSKHWQQFMAPEAPRPDFVFTLCDRAAREICPVWPGNPITANWSVPDPAAAATAEVEQAFRDAFRLPHQHPYQALHQPAPAIAGAPVPARRGRAHRPDPSH